MSVVMEVQRGEINNAWEWVRKSIIKQELLESDLEMLCSSSFGRQVREEYFRSRKKYIKV